MIRPHRIQDGGKVAGLADWDEDDWGHLGCKRTTCVYCGRQALSYEDDRMFDYCGHMTNIKVPMKDGSVSYACVGICHAKFITTDINVDLLEKTKEHARHYLNSTGPFSPRIGQ